MKKNSIENEKRFLELMQEKSEVKYDLAGLKDPFCKTANKLNSKLSDLDLEIRKVAKWDAKHQVWIIKNEGMK